MSDFTPSFTAAKLYRKTSQKGTTYFVGRMGGVKVAFVKSKEVAENGDEIWSLMFSEAKPYKATAAAKPQAPEDRYDAPPPDRGRAPGPDDEIPF